MTTVQTRSLWVPNCNISAEENTNDLIPFWVFSLAKKLLRCHHKLDFNILQIIIYESRELDTPVETMAGNQETIHK